VAESPEEWFKRLKRLSEAALLEEASQTYRHSQQRFEDVVTIAMTSQRWSSDGLRLAQHF